MSLRKTAVIIILIIVATAGAVAAMVFANKEEPPKKINERHWEVRSQQIELGAHQPQIKLLGTIEPEQDRTVVAQIATTVKSVSVRQGDPVAADTLLIELDDFDAQQQLQQTQAELLELETRKKLQASAQKLDVEALAVEQANLELLNNQLTNQTRITSAQSTLDELKQQIQRQKLLVMQRQAAVNNHALDRQQLDIQSEKLQLALASAQRNLARTKITAPFAGSLAQLLVSTGQSVSPGTPLFKIYSHQNLTIKVQLPSKLFNERQQLAGEVFTENRRSNATFSHNESQLNANQSGFISWFSIDTSTQWLPGEVVQLAVNLPAINDTFSVPAEAIFQDRWAYKIDAQQQLQAVAVKVLGYAAEQENHLIVQPEDEVDASIRLLTTRLNNPLTGIKVFEKGVDPQVDDAEQDNEVTDENA